MLRSTDTRIDGPRGRPLPRVHPHIPSMLDDSSISNIVKHTEA